jgi:hypothetical protein
MERRNLLAGLMALVISSILLTGTALAHKTPTKGKATAGSDPAACVIHSLPSFMAQGEFKRASSVADIIEIECESVYAEHYVKVSSQELYNACADKLSWYVDEKGYTEGPSVGKVQLDDDGNAIVVAWGGPSCASISESLVSAHLEEAPYQTVTTAFTVKAPKPTTPGVTALVPNLSSSQVENDTISAVATVVQVEFPPVYAEKEVNVSDEQLFDSCQLTEPIAWVGPDAGETIEGEPGLRIGGVESVKLKLDNDGNAFVVLFGYDSCAAGPSEIDASLEVAPYTTYTTTFTVIPPEETF